MRNHDVDCVTMTQENSDARGREWSKGWSQQIGDQVRSWRAQAGLSAQDLADRTSRLGYAVSRNTVASMENGRKEQVTVQEVLVLARALQVSPIALLFPVTLGRETAPVFVMPQGFDVPSLQAALWFTGEDDHAPSDLHWLNLREAADEPTESWEALGGSDSGILEVRRLASRLVIQASALMAASQSLLELFRSAENADTRDGYRAAIALLLATTDQTEGKRVEVLKSVGLPHERPVGLTHLLASRVASMKFELGMGDDS